MSKEKQMVNDLIEIFDEEYSKRHLLTPQNTAEKLMQKGYRKASDVAEEIFAEIEKHTQEKKKAISMFKDGEDDFYDGEIHALDVFEHFIAELKKKYTEERNETN